MNTSWTNNLTYWLFGSGNERARCLREILKEKLRNRFSEIEVPPVKMSDIQGSDSISSINSELVLKPQFCSTLMSVTSSNTYESINSKPNNKTEDIVHNNAGDSLNVTECLDEEVKINVSVASAQSKESDIVLRDPHYLKLHRSSFSIYEPPPIETVTILDDLSGHLRLHENTRLSLPANPSEYARAKPKIEKPKRKHVPSKRSQDFHSLSLNSSNNSVYNDGDDSRIIKEIVVDKYNSILERFRRRSLNRQTQRRNSKYAELINDDNGCELLSVSMPSIISMHDCPPNCTHNSSFNIEDLPKDVRDLALRLLKERSDMEDSVSIQSSIVTNNFYDSQSFLKAALGSELSTDTKYSSFASLSIQEENEDDASQYSGEPLEPLPNQRFFGLKTLTIKELRQELLVQEEIILQTSKALQYCKSNKKFLLSTEQIEAERILLIASITKDVLQEEIQRKAKEDLISDEKSNGYIKMANIVFPFKQLLVDDGNNKTKDTVHYFVCILTCGIRVIASKVLTARNGVLNIDTDFVFAELTKNFTITIYIYCLKTKSKSSISHDTRFIKIKKKVPSPKKIFSLSRESFKHCIVHPYDLRQSSFLLLGKVAINRDNFHERKFKMVTMSRFTMLDETFTLDMQSKVFLSNKIQGFLTIAIVEGEYPVWNRRWCLLVGHQLKYWNYPSDENTTNPLGLIDLRHCVSQKIGHADRTLCARQKTLLLQIKQHGSVINHFLSCDNLVDFKNWQDQLEFVIKSLRDWNFGAA